MNITSFPINVLFVAYIALLAISVLFMQIGIRVTDKAEENGNPTSLTVQRDRAFRTGAWALGVSFIVAMMIAGTFDFGN